MKVTFWLILILTTAKFENPQLMHVGNFSTQEQCAEAAKKSTLPTFNPAEFMVAPRFTFLCIQANDADTTPPGGLRQGFLR